MSQEKGIAEILLEQGKINSDQISAVKLENVNTGKNIEDILISRKLVNDKDLLLAKSQLYNAPYKDLKDLEVPTEVLDMVPEQVSKRYSLMPFMLEGDTLSVVMADPLDLQAIEFIERKTRFTIKPFIGMRAEIEKEIAAQYGRNIGKDVTEALEEVEAPTKIEEQIKDINKVEDVLRDAPVARIVGALLELGVKSRASDIHIEPLDKNTIIRYRIDGVLREKVAPLPRSVHSSLVARIKILSGLKIDEKRKPQDGRFKIQVGDIETDLRVSVLPTVTGEKVVIRFLREGGETPSLKELGLRGVALKRFEEALLKPHGIILVTGPTGSGKTVTLATSLTKLNSKRVNIVTVEDPVEIRIKGVNHVQVNNQAGLTFANALRAFLRQDPNIIMVGEIRDSETAKLAIHASLVGRLVLSTLHTNSAAGAIPRFLDMGIENFLLASTLVLVLAQRLVRKICPYCKESYEAPPALAKTIKDTLGGLYSKELENLGEMDVTITSKVGNDNEKKQNLESKLEKSSKDKVVLYRGKGCDKCNNEGYTGRIGIFEVMPISDKIGRCILERRPGSEIDKIAQEEGMVSLVQDGFIKSLEGVTTIEEVMMVARE